MSSLVPLVYLVYDVWEDPYEGSKELLGVFSSPPGLGHVLPITDRQPMDQKWVMDGSDGWVHADHDHIKIKVEPMLVRPGI